MHPADEGVTAGVSVICTSIGVATIHAMFKDLIGVIDISFLVLKEEITTLLSIKDVLDNGLYIFIKKRYVSPGTRRHLQIMQNFS